MISRHPLLRMTPAGLYCPQADVYIDPWRRVPRAVITHAHSDHAYRGMGSYLAHTLTVPLLRHRLGDGITAEGMEYGIPVVINGVRISFHPAGHVIGSAQIRLEYGGEVWVASGDYKRQSDPYATDFEVVRCHTFITESTFGLPIYQWQGNDALAHSIEAWWRGNAARGAASIIYAYSLGKAQRLLGMIDTTIGPIFTHHSIHGMNQVIRNAGIPLPATLPLTAESDRGLLRKGLTFAPGAGDGAWLRSIGSYSSAAASGWMAARKRRSWGGTDTAFVISDHTDWPGLLRTIEETEATQVLVTHGFSATVARYLGGRGIDARELGTPYGEKEQH